MWKVNPSCIIRLSDCAICSKSTLFDQIPKNHPCFAWWGAKISSPCAPLWNNCLKRRLLYNCIIASKIQVIHL
ncbi:hypothetical protein CW304_29700 [Bacillus sp. UFRGS-B20]|nr:hypothetical protein CW304_29700 [Bacillus sp. UFRGS-B20]